MAQANETERSGIETMVMGLMQDLRVLVRQEIALAKHEMEYEFGKILKAIVWWGIAAVLAMIGLIVIVAACVLILFEYTGFPAWVCAAIVSIILLGGAWGLVVMGRGIAKSIRVAPLRAIRILTGDVKWIREWVHTRSVS
jgi:uncharacterized membrane protein YqjE